MKVDKCHKTTDIYQQNHILKRPSELIVVPNTELNIKTWWRISSNLIGSLSLANEQCLPPGKYNEDIFLKGIETVAGVNSPFAVVTNANFSVVTKFIHAC